MWVVYACVYAHVGGICMGVYMWVVYTCVCIVYVYVLCVGGVYICVHVWVVYACVFMCGCIHVCACSVCVCVCVCVCVYTYLCTCSVSIGGCWVSQFITGALFFWTSLFSEAAACHFG